MAEPMAIRDHAALVAYLDARVRAPFAWWEQDCVSFGARAAQVQTGRDLLKAFGARWSTAAGAARVLKAHGGLAAAVDSLLPRIAPAMARRGDLGLVRIEPHDCLVVVEGDLVVGPGLTGLVRLPRGRLTAAWSIG
jgi:hypothetical protein